MSYRSVLLASAIVLACMPGARAATGAPPQLDVELTPQAHAGKVDAIAVSVRIAAPDIAAGNVLLHMPLLVVGTPTMAYPATAITASDAAGPLLLTSVDEAPTPSGTYRQYLAARATVGDVVVGYTGTPRQVDAQTRNGPLFDLRAEGAGLLGAGVYFMALPPGDQPYRIGLTWKLDGLPAGTRGVWSLGEGEQHTVGPTQLLSFSSYATGPVSSAEDGDANFGVYWLSPPPFDMATLAADTHKLYRYMARFFHDENSTYHIFARRNPYPAGGGTALSKSFIFAYGRDGQSTSSGDRQMLLAHEMAHNWPRLDSEDHGATAWYTEGTAEYYSTALALRAGVIDLDKFTTLVNERAANYAGNPYKSLSNEDAGKIFWKDARAQRIPYGRGFMYFARVDAQLRARSGGKHSLDDLVLDVRARQIAGEKVGMAQWRALIEQHLGASGVTELDDMVAGKDIDPPANTFAPCLKPVAYRMRPFELGFDEMSLGVVKDLRADSAAAAAGIQNGDTITSLPALPAIRQTEGAALSLGLQRGERPLTIRYVPRGAEVSAWRWQRTAAGNCTL